MVTIQTWPVVFMTIRIAIILDELPPVTEPDGYTATIGIPGTMAGIALIKHATVSYWDSL